MEYKRNISRKELSDYLLDRCQPDEALEVKAWFRENMDNPAYDRMFDEVLDALDIESEPESKERVRKRLAALIPQNGRRRRRNVVLGAIAIGVMSILLVASTVSALYYRRQAATPDIWTKIYAPPGQTRDIVLPDSTCIRLKAGSTLIYLSDFNNSLRQVYLSGEMFADVRRDTRRPFIVSLDNMEVKVLGTKFNVKSYGEDRKSEVRLVEGRITIDIHSDKMNSSLLMAPGDIVRYDKNNKRISLLEFDPEAYDYLSENSFYFTDQSLSDIVAELRRHFNVDIILQDKSLGELTYYASFINGESLEVILNALNSREEFSLDKYNDTYYISSNKSKTRKPM